jgi:carboxypeptidase C (cathepsin A)
MRPRSKLTVLCLATVAVFAWGAGDSTRAQGAAEPIVRTAQQIQINGQTLAYTAEVGRLPIRHAETGEVRGRIFYVAYRRLSTGSPRPVTFVWNGGPGANATLLHFEAFGPRRFAEDGLADNPETLLAETDLVFVDPVGTGYSRPEKAEYGAEFYSTLGDFASIAEFVRLWRIHNEAEAAPVFLMGESFGVWRAAAVAELMEKRGDHVDGIMLISGGAGVGRAVPPAVTNAYRVPSRTAAALTHGRLAADLAADPERALRQAEAWAAGPYLTALESIATLGAAEKDAVARQLERFTGLQADAVDRDTLVVRPRDYLEGLFRDEGRKLNTFDMRIASDGSGGGAGVRSDIVERHFRDDLGYRSDLVYLGSGRGFTDGYIPVTQEPPAAVGSRWNYDSGEITPEVMASAMAGEGPPGAQPWSLRAAALNPGLRIFVAAGLYDSLNSCAGNDDLVRRLEPQVAGRFTMKCYAGGHMMYRDRDAHIELHRDLAAFLRAAASK